jgi:hypothetical protein
MSAFKREPIQAKKREETDSTTVQASRHLRKLDRDVFRSAFPPRHFTQKGAQEELQGLLQPSRLGNPALVQAKPVHYRVGRNEHEKASAARS